MRWKKLCLAAIATIIGLLALCIVSFFAYRHFDRLEWKRSALSEIAAFANDKPGVDAEISRLESIRKPNSEQCNADAWWISGRLMLMKNGEWLAYKSACCHDSPLISDRFIAKASNGKWYFSTYHFCNGMLCLLMDLQKQPKDLSLFLKAFNFVEFDGLSNDCLEKTAFSPNTQALQALNQ